MNISNDVKIIEVNEMPHYEFITNGDDEFKRFTFGNGDFIEMRFNDIISNFYIYKNRVNAGDGLTFLVIRPEDYESLDELLVATMLKFKNENLRQEFESKLNDCIWKIQRKFVDNEFNFDDLNKNYNYLINFINKTIIADDSGYIIKYHFQNDDLFNKFIANLVKIGLESELLGNNPNGEICSNNEFREKVEKSGLTQKEIAVKIGMSERGFRQILADDLAATKRNHNYCQQFAVENLRPFLSIKVSNVGNHIADKSTT